MKKFKTIKTEMGNTLIIGGRQTGKTEEIINICFEKGYPIITGNVYSRKNLISRLVKRGMAEDKAEDLVFTADRAKNIFKGNVGLTGISREDSQKGKFEHILIDDLEVVLLYLLNVAVGVRFGAIAIQE